VNALCKFFVVQGEEQQFRLTTYISVAVRSISGLTLHVLLQLSEGKQNLSTKVKRDLAVMWEGTNYLFINEISMIGCEMLRNISRALMEVKGTTVTFGCVNVIFAGDFAQLPPIGGTWLCKDVNTTSIASAVS